MGKRLYLQSELQEFLPKVYFQPPSNITLEYPCIIYNKSGMNRKIANDASYLRIQKYSVTLIERDPDSTVADDIEKYFTHCAVTGYFTKDNLYHTSLTLTY